MPHCHDPSQPDICGQCRRYLSDTAFAAFLDRSRPAIEMAKSGKRPMVSGRVSTKTTPTICPHLGKPTGEAVNCSSCRGMVSFKVFGCNLHGRCLMGSKSVDGLQCCGTCDDRPRRVGKPSPWSNPIIIPSPPKPSLRHENPVALVTVAAGKEGREMHAISGPLMERYAERIGADYYVSHWEGHPDWPISSKYAIGPYLDGYDTLIYLDADVIVPLNAVDLLKLPEKVDFAAFDELPWHRKNPQHKTESEYYRLAKFMGLPDRKLFHYWNAGVFVISKRAASLVAIPDRPIPPRHNSDQDLINARVNISDAVCGKLNCHVATWWTDHDFMHARDDAILHFAGARPHADRLKKMKELAAR